MQSQPLTVFGNDLPACAGISLKADHYETIGQGNVSTGFLEVHAENYFGAGGTPHHWLSKARENHALSVHGVGLSLGSAARVDQDHLLRLKAVVDRYQPQQVSEHIAFARHEGAFLNDLLPLPYTDEALAWLVDNIDETQQALGQRILVENPSTYLTFAHSTLPETEFIVEACRKSGAGLLLDINNVYVCARNHGFEAAAWLADIPADLVGEIHLAGHTVKQVEGVELRIDDHGSAVCKEVWALYESVIARIGPRPTLIEWDTDVPPLATLLAEAAKADAIMADKAVANG
ncbi:MAG: DUF692 domain-containing protein [Alphaproteobacteria bacterium]